MSYDAGQYRWRETYFVWFLSSRRPTLQQVEETIRKLDTHYAISNSAADPKGFIESVTVTSPVDNSALEIDYAVGDDVLLEANRLAEEFGPDDGDPAKRDQLPRCDARFEVMHFERFFDGETEEESEEMFDPTALVIVIEALIELTRGVGVDPQSGMLL